MIGKRFHPAIDEIAPLIIEALGEGKEVKLTVTGYSMYPALRSRVDCVLLEKSNEFDKYDVVLFKRETGAYILHRIIKKRGDKFTFAGDNETTKEYPVEASACIARMKGFWRKDKYHTTSELWYRMYCVVWLAIFPLRTYAAGMYRFLTRNVGKIKKKMKKRPGR